MMMNNITDSTESGTAGLNLNNAVNTTAQIMINSIFSGLKHLNDSIYGNGGISGIAGTSADIIDRSSSPGNFNIINNNNNDHAKNHHDHHHHNNNLATGSDGNASSIGVTDGGIRDWQLTVYSQGHLIVTSIILGLFVLCCIIGNCFVIAAVLLERSLHNVANHLIVSLAVADLMVAVLVMPLSVVSEISRVWFLHQEVCDMWISVDVLCCTASILHLVAISLDRYWAVTGIDYIRKRSAKRILLMIFTVWIVALFISIPPLFGWRDPKNDPDITGECIISQDKGYTIFSTVGAFYLPMILMMIIYAKIYVVAKSRIRKDKFHKRLHKKKTEETTLVSSPKTEYSVVSQDCNGCGENSPPDASSENGGKKKRRAPFKSYGCSPRPERKKRGGNNKPGSTDGNTSHNGVNGNSSSNNTDRLQHLTVIEPDAFTTGVNDEAKLAMLDKHTNNHTAHTPSHHPQNNADSYYYFQKNKEKLELKRERKAARTLAIITGAFIICWLPFFIVALIGPFVEDEETRIPPFARSFILWLGYFNSLLNPIIYTIFSPEFRSAFHKILFGKYRRRAGR